MREEIASFIGKWAARDPAIRLVLLFAPHERAEGVGLWYALMRELEDAALHRSTAHLGAAKIGFYARAFDDPAGGGHPLVRAWRERSAGGCGERLASSVGRLMDLVSVPSPAALERSLESWASTASQAAAALFGERLATAAIAADFVLRRLAEVSAEAARGRLWLPLDLLAAEGLDRGSVASAVASHPALARARGALARWWLERIEPGGGPVGAVQVALIRLRLKRLARSGRTAWPALRALWVAWGAARGARRRGAAWD